MKPKAQRQGAARLRARARSSPSTAVRWQSDQWTAAPGIAIASSPSAAANRHSFWNLTTRTNILKPFALPASTRLRTIRPRIDPSLILIAEDDGKTAGFVFGLPDWLQVQRGEPRDTMIVKTLARRADERYRGLGSVLLERCRQAALEGGYRRCIHALMYDENASLGLSNRFGTTMRGYTLYARELTAK